MIMKISTILCLIIYSLNSSAATQCSKLFVFDFFAHLPKQEDAKLFRTEKAFLDQVARTLEIDMSKVRLSAVKEGERPLFLPSTGEVKVILTFDKVSVQDSSIIFSHEYTHSIFETYMRTRSLKWNNQWDFHTEANAKLWSWRFSLKTVSLAS